MTDQTVDPTAAANAAPAEASPLYLVDGSGFIFRAFHAIPILTRPDGTPVNAVMGYANMLMKLLADLHADSVAVVFDSKRENFRNAIYPAYKAQRPEPPEELRPQFGLIREATDAFCLPCLELEGYEADDLIATYARLAHEAGRPVTIVSSDKDLMQLVRPGVRMFDPLKNRMIAEAEVLEKFGVAPDKVVDVQALAGDSVDNVPGVPGIGVKTAAQLITEYGDLETLLARAGEIKQPARRQKLIDFADQARVSRRLVLLDDHVPVPKPMEELKVREPDHDKLVAFLRAQGFRSLITRLENELHKDGKLTDGTASATQADPLPRPAGEGQGGGTPSPAPDTPRDRPRPSFDGVEKRYELVQDVEALKVWVQRALEGGVLAVDTETNSLTPATAKLVGISLCTEPGLACYVPVGHVDPHGAGQLALGGEGPTQLTPEQAIAVLKDVLEDASVLKIGHNFKFDWQLFARLGVRVSPVDDTMLMSYVLEGASHGHGMDELADLLLGYTTIKYDEVTGTGKQRITFDRVELDKARDYAAEDADVTLRLWRVLKPRLIDARLVTVYETLERPIIPVVADMELAGVRIDRAELRRLSQDFAERLIQIEAGIHALAPRPFNVGSPKQLGEILFDEMKLGGDKTAKKGKTGAYSTDSSVLEGLAEQGHEIAQRVLDWRQLAKLKSTYTDALQEQADANDRIHTSFAMAVTNTGRLSSTDPNLQNIPIRNEEGRKIRRAFVAEPGCKLLSIDYSQIELRLVAEMAGIEALKTAFREGIDVHAMTASQVFGVPLDQMTSEIRRKAKAINFGIIYGISGFGLGRQLGIQPGEANAFIKAYLERFHELKDWMEATKVFTRKHGYVCTLFGRRCFIPGIHDKNAARRAFAERQAINAPIQGTAADIMKRAMARVPAALDKAGSNARLLLQVHDELLFEVPAGEAEAAAAAVRAVMEGAASFSVPLVAEAGIGDSWAEAH
ncbi:MAG TPA: DNA polymerase I [Azospirillum sp.]